MMQNMAGAKRRTLVLANLASVMELADESLLPAVYKEVGAALHATPAALGALTLFCSFVKAACYPLAAYLAARHNRARVIAAGAFIWAAATSLLAVSDTFVQMAVFRGLNGVGLALVLPAITSLVADYTDGDSNRGSIFGWLQLTSNIGSILGGLFAVLLAPTTFLGIPGWRLAFHIVALISVLVGIVVWFFAEDPHCERNSGGVASRCKTRFQEAKYLIKEAKNMIWIPSFQIIVAEGITSSILWSSLSFATMWLELIGFTHRVTGAITTLFWVAAALGALFGAMMGDWFAQQFPNSGRIAVSHVSSVTVIPLTAVLLLALPNDPSMGVIHGVAFFAVGLSVSWNVSATKNTIFAEIVPEMSRTTIYALDKTFDGAFSSFAPPIVGILAENVFGYKPVHSGKDRHNAAALAKAVFTAIAVPKAICCIAYSFLYFNYPRDRDHRAQMDSLIASQNQHCRTGDGSESSTVTGTGTTDEEFGSNTLNERLLAPQRGGKEELHVLYSL